LHDQLSENCIEVFRVSLSGLSVVVSGASINRQIARESGEIELVAETQDRAGEAFEKESKLLGFLCPGCHLVNKFAKAGDGTKFRMSLHDY
jgi:tRNA A37 threonylcarbamoyltransferase TsaD